MGKNPDISLDDIKEEFAKKIGTDYSEDDYNAAIKNAFSKGDTKVFEPSISKTTAGRILSGGGSVLDIDRALGDAKAFGDMKEAYNENGALLSSISKDVNREKTGIYNVLVNGKEATTLQKYDLDALNDVINFEKGFDKNGKGFGSVHIEKHLTNGSVGEVNLNELLNIGNVVRNYDKLSIINGDKGVKRVYEKNIDGVNFFSIIGERPDFERVISFYSDRNLQGLTANASLYNNLANSSSIILKFEPKSNISEGLKNITDTQNKILRVELDNAKKAGEPILQFRYVNDKIEHPPGGATPLDADSPLSESIPQTQIKSQELNNLYHVSIHHIGDLNYKKILWTTQDINYALKYGKNNSRIIYKVENADNLNILDGYSNQGKKILEEANKKAINPMSDILNKDDGVSSFAIQDKKVIDYLKSKGYDGVITSDTYNGGIKATAIINPEKVKLIEKAPHQSITDGKASVSESGNLSDKLSSDNSANEIKSQELYQAAAKKQDDDIKSAIQNPIDHLRKTFMEPANVLEKQVQKVSWFLRGLDAKGAPKDIRLLPILSYKNASNTLAYSI